MKLHFSLRGGKSSLVTLRGVSNECPVLGTCVALADQALSSMAPHSFCKWQHTRPKSQHEVTQWNFIPQSEVLKFSYSKDCHWIRAININTKYNQSVQDQALHHTFFVSWRQKKVSPANHLTELSISGRQPVWVTFTLIQGRIWPPTFAVLTASKTKHITPVWEAHNLLKF